VTLKNEYKPTKVRVIKGRENKLLLALIAVIGGLILCTPMLLIGGLDFYLRLDRGICTKAIDERHTETRSEALPADDFPNELQAITTATVERIIELAELELDYGFWDIDEITYSRRNDQISLTFLRHSSLVNTSSTRMIVSLTHGEFEDLSTFTHLCDIQNRRQITSYKFVPFVPPVFTADGTKFATIAECGSSPIDLRDADTGEVVGSLGECNGAGIEIMAFSPDGTLLVIARSVSSVEFWDIQNNHSLTILDALNDPQERIYGMAFNQDGTLLALAFSDTTVQLWGVPEQ
jgi:WD40 repeat protein